MMLTLDPNHDGARLAKGVELPGTPKGIDRLVIRPGNRLVMMFDLLVAVCVLYSSVAAPMNVAYRATFLEELEVLFDVLFSLDMALQFVCGYMERGYPVLSLRTVARRYARTWFLIDLVAVIPWEALSEGLSVLRLIKTVRLLRLRRLLNHTQLMAGGNFVRVVIILFVWLLITHWAGETPPHAHRAAPSPPVADQTRPPRLPLARSHPVPWSAWTQRAPSSRSAGRSAAKRTASTRRHG